MAHAASSLSATPLTASQTHIQAGRVRSLFSILNLSTSYVAMEDRRREFFIIELSD